MPLSTREVSKHFRLKKGEQWVRCVNCGRVMAKVLADGRLEIKTDDGFHIIEGKPGAMVTSLCNCTHPPTEDVLSLNKA